MDQTKLLTRTAKVLSNTGSHKPVEPATLSPCRLDATDLASLMQFANSAVEARDSYELAKATAHNVYYHTGAAFAGFFNLDASSPLAKAVWPENANVDEAMARQLTRRVQRNTKTVWLAEDTAAGLATAHFPGGFQDAFCLPIKSKGIPIAALHVCKTGGYFAERDRLYVESVASLVGPILDNLRQLAALESSNVEFQSSNADELVGDSPAMVGLRSSIAQASANSCPILIVGENGTNPIAVAQDIHRRGPRSKFPFIVVPSANGHDDLFEAELFGYRRGAFSGAVRDHFGLVASADGGTLYIEEFADLSREAQLKLSRLMDSRNFRPLGASHDLRADTRIIAYTRFQPEAEIASGKFNEALANEFLKNRVSIPPLRERPGDVPYLAQYYLDFFSTEFGSNATLTPAMTERLQRYTWPGNSRQLRAVIEAIVSGGTKQIDFAKFAAMLGDC